MSNFPLFPHESYAVLLENKSSKLKQGMHEDATSSYYKDTSKLIETVCNKKGKVVESDRRVALGVQCMVSQENAQISKSTLTKFMA